MNRHRTRSFDCVEMKRRIQERMYEQTKSMTPDQLLAYIRERAASSRFAAATVVEKPVAPATEDDVVERGPRGNGAS